MAGLIWMWAALLGLAALTGHFMAVLLVTCGAAVLTLGLKMLYSDDW